MTTKGATTRARRPSNPHGAGRCWSSWAGCCRPTDCWSTRRCCRAYRHDEAEWAEVGRAEIAVRARTEAEVAATVRVAAELGVPIVSRGAGTGLSGGANAVDGCVILDLSKMTAIVDIDPDNLTCVVQPGIVNNDLKAAVAEHGLWYPPDPASAPWSTIGGNVATNAGGLCCLKYGVTRDYVLGLRAVVGGPGRLRHRRPAGPPDQQRRCGI